jgi:hypothetical protein
VLALSRQPKTSAGKGGHRPPALTERILLNLDIAKDGMPVELAVSADGSRLFCRLLESKANTTRQKMLVIDAQTHTIITSVVIPNSVLHLYPSPDGKMLLAYCLEFSKTGMKSLEKNYLYNFTSPLPGISAFDAYIPSEVTPWDKEGQQFLCLDSYDLSRSLRLVTFGKKGNSAREIHHAQGRLTAYTWLPKRATVRCVDYRKGKGLTVLDVDITTSAITHVANLAVESRGQLFSADGRWLAIAKRSATRLYTLELVDLDGKHAPRTIQFTDEMLKFQYKKEIYFGPEPDSDLHVVIKPFQMQYVTRWPIYSTIYGPAKALRKMDAASVWLYDSPGKQPAKQAWRGVVEEPLGWSPDGNKLYISQLINAANAVDFQVVEIDFTKYN